MHALTYVWLNIRMVNHVKVLVDIFHVLKHKELCCMLPHLETLREIKGTNTEFAEQSNRFLNKLKHMCNRMAEFKFLSHCYKKLWRDLRDLEDSRTC